MHRYWNHNTHYHQALLKLLPSHRRRILDVGCGDGLFARRLSERAEAVWAIDSDPQQVHATKARCAGESNVHVARADGRSMPFPDCAMDAVTSLATIHHMPLESAITEMVRVLRPGGQLVVLGVWPDAASAVDLAASLVAVILNRYYVTRWGEGTMNAPTQRPAMSMRQIRDDLDGLLPGARLRRRLLWRYTVTWNKPIGDVAEDA